MSNHRADRGASGSDWSASAVDRRMAICRGPRARMPKQAQVKDDIEVEVVDLRDRPQSSPPRTASNSSVLGKDLEPTGAGRKPFAASGPGRRGQRARRRASTGDERHDQQGRKGSAQGKRQRKRRPAAVPVRQDGLSSALAIGAGRSCPEGRRFPGAARRALRGFVHFLVQQRSGA